MTDQLSLPAEAPPAPPVSRQARERVLRMAAGMLDLSRIASGACWSLPIAELLVAASDLAAYQRSARIGRPDPDDLLDVEAWIAEAEAWLLGGAQ